MPSESPRENSFLDLYMEYTRDQEAPDAFHLWTATTILAAAMGRKCFFNKGYYRLYPNLFVVLVAGSSKCRKSTAINLGLITPDEVELFADIPTTKIYSGSVTPEQFTRELSNAKSPSQADPNRLVCPNILVHSSELSVFLKKQSYAEPLINLLTDLFDCPRFREYKTKNRGIDTLQDVFLCILAATTPDGISKSIPPSALSEGFASRVLWVYQASSDRENALPELTDRQRELSRDLKKMLEERSGLYGEFQLSAEARVAYKEWYHKYMSTPPPDKFTEGAYGRKHDHLLRLGIIIAGNYMEKIIEPWHLDAGLSMLDNIESTMQGAFMELGGDESTVHLMRARSLLQKHRRLHHSELIRKMYPCDAYAFNQRILPTLVQAGEVKICEGRMYEWIG